MVISLEFQNVVVYKLNKISILAMLVILNFLNTILSRI